MSTIRKHLAFFLSFVLSFSLMGVPAYAVEPQPAGEGTPSEIQTDQNAGADESVSAEQHATEQAAVTDSEGAVADEDSAAEPVGQSADAQEEAATDDFSVTRLSPVDAVAFVYVDTSVIAAGETQYIAIGFTDESLAVRNAKLQLASSATDEPRVLESAAVAPGAVLFALRTTDADIAGYVIESLTWQNEGGDAFALSFQDDPEKGNSYSFEVVTPALAQTLVEADEVSAAEGVSVLTIDDAGNMSAHATIEEALNVSDPNAAAKGQAGESIVLEQPKAAEVVASPSEAAGESGASAPSQLAAATPETESAFQSILDSIVSFFRSLFVPEDAYAAVSSARENYLLVAIDPGHGGYDSGACGNGLQEKEVNLSIASYFRDELNTYSGVSTLMTRTGDEYVGLQERVDKAIRFHADVFISVHCNSTGTGSAYGAEVWVPNYASYLYEETHVAGYELGDKILTQLTALGLHKRDVKTRDCTSGDTYPDGSLADYYSVIYGSRYAGFPGIIVEHAFIDNASDASTYLASDGSRRELGIADATGVANQYSLIKDSAAQASSSVRIAAHVSELGWESYVYDGKVAGTTGKSLPVEAFEVCLQNDAASLGGIEYRSASVNGDWQGWVSDGALSGTTGQSKPIEAIEMQLKGGADEHYDVYYRTHVANIGWLGWAKNGEPAGNIGYGYSVEALEVVVVEKGADAPGSTETPYAVQGPTIKYSTHVENYGWQNPVTGPSVAGTTGEGLRLEAVEAHLSGFDYAGEVQISTHVQDYGWQDFVSEGEIAGTTGQSLRLEAIRVRLTGEMAEHYDVYYRTHVQYFGWMDWAKNGESAGSAGYGYRMEAIQIVLVEKGGEAPGSTEEPFSQKVPMLSYSAHVEDIGWQSAVDSPASAGTTGRSLRVEAIKASLSGFPYSGDIQISTHVQNIGWQDYVNGGEIAGTTGESLRLEAMRVRLTGEMANHYDVYYRVHAQEFGWMGWAKNGESAGTSGFSYRLEAIQIALVEKGGEAPGSTRVHFVGTTIMGDSQTTVEQMVARYNYMGREYPSDVYAKYGAPDIASFCQILYEEAAAEGVCAEIVFVQAMHETGWLQFGGDVQADQCNFSGLGATGGGNPGNSFNDWGTESVRKGLRAQVQHLKAYGSTEALNQPCVDPRFHYVRRGCAPTLDHLTGTWAMDSRYAEKLKDQLYSLMITS